MTTPTLMVYYQLRLFGKEEVRENCATGTMLCSSLTKASTQEDRVISATPIYPITKLATWFIRKWGYSVACGQVSVLSDRRRIVNSDWDVMPHQRNQELSSPQVTRGAIIIIRQCAQYKEMFGIICRYLVSMVDTCRLGTLQRGI